MAQKLNNTGFLLLLLLSAVLPLSAQEERTGDKDYKSPEQFEKFHKRRKIVSAWQINQLKQGALVVRLKTNHLLINGLISRGNTRLAEEKRLENEAGNLNTMRAYLSSYNFSKVYFIFSNSSDSLLNGSRSNIFLDTSLTIDPAITMTEKFYLIAERDYTYNSSIGYVKEDSARFVTEQGTAAKEMGVVVKDKFGHQLKKPFPYDTPDGISITAKPVYSVYIPIRGKSIPFNISSIRKIAASREERGAIPYIFEGSPMTLDIPRYLTYQRLSLTIESFNAGLYRYYRSAYPVEKERTDPAVRPFLY